MSILLAYEPAGLSCTPPPPPMIKHAHDRGCVYFFAWASSANNFFFLEKVDFVGDIRIGTHQNVVLRHNHLNPISTNLISFDNNE